mmetsp:Transcript_74/g.78  ORF Transcript_74/g.78 Transcript_74/m.78 type:complete len:100 (-) Transcript_74:270-569(-)|eukprot:CAMPEP_0197831962 /NCGR_PEP_ID=MMETSP1437-20131217/12873_1 /TAXON_ID=49252 ORGANISM="Eucampia antarctica, Strain CCMP1452" /NCGR_SAMPLE_ID=MMETSP1437 /ASSEMBLY_ACC=CAM_ASM_001096 /LENGTH=99 /DNA_ID=CAMNT_0043435117 /DNA_START=85 /DNA_END=384 /DNA_ORIENTATION=-
MTDQEVPKTMPAATPAPATSTHVAPPPPPKVAKWKLPDGMEDYVEEGLIKTAAGAVVGGIVGAVIFRSGGGWRGASAAMGIGAGLGSTIERAIADPRLQ